MAAVTLILEGREFFVERKGRDINGRRGFGAGSLSPLVLRR